MARLKAIELAKEDRKTNSGKFKGFPYLANGQNNDYPTIIEQLVAGSPTARACAGVIADFIYGRGFALEIERREQAKSQGVRFRKDVLFVNDKRETPNDLLKKVSRSIAMHKGAFVHVNYNGFYEKTSVQVLPYKNCRLGAKDSSSYRGKVLVYNDWDKITNAKDKDKSVVAIDRYDPRPEVIEAQVAKAGGWDKYKGQVVFLNLDRNDTYPLAWADVVLLDCESERLSGIFTRNGFKKGFFGTYSFVTLPMESEAEREDFRNELKKRNFPLANSTKRVFPIRSV